MINEIFRKPPFYGDLGPPMYMIMSRTMDTQGGFSAYTKENLNRHFKRLFETWATYLASADSRYVLVDKQFDEKHYGWFAPNAKAAMMTQYAAGRTFEDVFICDPSAEYHGYVSYEDFFNRRFRSPQIDRPVIGGNESISAACESVVYHYQEDVKRSDQLFIKDEAYSLVHLLYNDNLVDQFLDGIILQGFLNTTGYHRWHAPVNGTIRKIVDVPGTYFAQAPNTIGTAPAAVFDNQASELPPYLRSLTYFANTAARKLIFIDADDTQIGLMCFISIGMTEISTCEVTVYTGQHVNRGEQLGMFHFGGSSFALVFRKGTVEIDGTYRNAKPDQEVPMKINETIGVSKSAVI